MTMKVLLALAALAGATPLAAQEAAPPATDAAAALPAPDPERLAAAERVVDRIWPVGTFRRIMESSFAGMTQTVTGLGTSATGWAAEDNSKEARRAQHEARTGHRIGGGAPERSAESAMASFNAVMLPIMERMEPPVRAAIARIYARRYTLTQLGELEAFFSTPTGSAYAADSLTLMSDPEMVATIQAATMEMIGSLARVAGEEVGTAEGAVADAAAAVMGPASVNARVKMEPAQ